MFCYLLYVESHVDCFSIIWLEEPIFKFTATPTLLSKSTFNGLAACVGELEVVLTQAYVNVA